MRRTASASNLAAEVSRRRVKLGLGFVLCLSLVLLSLYLDIESVIFWESLRRRSPILAVPRQQQSANDASTTSTPSWREEEEQTERIAAKMKDSLSATVRSMLLGLDTAIPEGWCDRAVQGTLNDKEVQLLRQWTFNESEFRKTLFAPRELPIAERAAFECVALRQHFAFAAEPLSEEEAHFPLAYSLLVHKSALQVFALLSAIYQPQNAYCIAMDDGAEEQFRLDMFLLADCFPNIFVTSAGKVDWCGYGVVRGVMGCLRLLSTLRHDWRYYQYLSGVDLPLKTNLEMVRIFKRLNGTANAEVLPFDEGRLSAAQKALAPPLPLWKSSLSALIGRAAVDAIIASDKVRVFLRYLQHGLCQDESLWTTILGNPKDLVVPGGFDASAFFFKLEEEVSRARQSAAQKVTQMPAGTATEASLLAEPFRLSTYYISRYQVWWRINPISASRDTNCQGNWVKESCVFGLGALPTLIQRPELIVHKLYLDFEPAAYFCLYQKVRQRALDWRAQRRFEASVYAQLPQVRLAAGEHPEQLRFFFEPIH